MACIEMQEKSLNPIAPGRFASSDVHHNKSAPNRGELRRYPAFAAGQAASSVRSPATKASGWSIIT